MRYILVSALFVYYHGPARAADDLVRTLQSEWAVLATMDRQDKSYDLDKEVRFGTFKSTTHYEIKLSAGCGRLRSEKIVLCWNTQYAFNLKRPKTATPEVWLLGELIVANPSENKLKQFFFANGFDGYLFEPLTAFYGSTCDKYLADGSLRVTGESRQDGLVRADFQLKAAFSDDPSDKPEAFSGYMILDPATHYLITEALITREILRDPGGSKQVKLSRTIVRTDDMLTAGSIAYDTLDGKSFEACRYSGYRFEDTDPNEFRVSHFGIPEPVGVTWEKPTPRYVWFLLGAGGFAALMLVFRYLARRRATTSPVPA